MAIRILRLSGVKMRNGLRTSPGKLFYYLLLLVSLFTAAQLFSGSTDKDDDTTVFGEEAIKVFLDVPRWYHDYIKTEIPFVHYVRDRKQAQVHALLTSQRTGSGGNEYTIAFIGHDNFTHMNDTLIYVSKKSDTEEMIRSGITGVIERGLVRYIAKTPLAENLKILYREKTDPMNVADKWKNWVFNVSLEGDMDGQESTKRLSMEGSVSADRVTPDWKISLYANSRYRENNYDLEDSPYTSISRTQRFRSSVVKSISDHWSAGLFGSINSDTYSNNKLSFGASPAIEYNVFPYSESTRRELRIVYSVGYTNIQYNEQTIYDKVRDDLFSQRLSATFEIKEMWGSIVTSLQGSHFFRDLSKNNVRLTTRLSIRLLEGISLSLRGRASMIHDQLSLAKEGASEEEILLQRKQLATQYNYSFSIGFRYTFGSIYSNVVNPRFWN